MKRVRRLLCSWGGPAMIVLFCAAATWWSRSDDTLAHAVNWSEAHRPGVGFRAECLPPTTEGSLCIVDFVDGETVVLACRRLGGRCERRD